MEKLKKILALVCAVSLMAAVTAGCGEQKASLPDVGAAAAEVAVDGELAKLITDASQIGEGTAGHSLKIAGLAYDVAALAAERNYGEDSAAAIQKTFEETTASLDDLARYSVETSFTDGVFPLLDSVILDGSYDSFKGQFEDAGAEDMEALLQTPGLADSYNALKSAYLAMGSGKD